MKEETRKKVLAIDPGTKYIGFALLEDFKLVHYGVKTILSTRHALHLGKEAVSRLLADYRPDTLVVEKTFFGNNRDSILLNTLAKQIQILGKKRGLKVMSIAANSVRKVVCGNGSASKDEVARAMVMKFPELKPYLTSNKRWKERYYRNMFDAVALGVFVVSEH
ncbi:MAG: crossover junction endodeoxyribonuclease RuvC [Bacteroidota bacterium]